MLVSNRKLHEQNETITNISIFNSHKLRKEVANLMGLIELERNNSSTSAVSERSSLALMQKTVQQLDDLLKKNEANLSKHLD